MDDMSSGHADVQTLDDLIRRLARQDIVAGILLMGTTGTPELTPTSDYDLLLVFSELPVPLRMVTTWVGGRLTEVYATTSRAVERVAAHPSGWRDGDEEGILVNWLRDGRIVHDQDGRLTIDQERLRREPPPAQATDGEIYEARRKIAYNVAQLERYLAADDPTSNVAADLRLLYSLFDVAFHYFTVRRLPWRGEKPAVRHWAEHDPAFLDLLRRGLAASDRRDKAALYVELAQRALAPAGGLWNRGESVVALGSAWGAGAASETGADPAAALAFWRSLAGETRQPPDRSVSRGA